MDFMDRLGLIAKMSNESLYINIYKYKNIPKYATIYIQELIIKDTQIIIV